MLRSDLNIFIQDALPLLGSPGTTIEADEAWDVEEEYEAGDTVIYLNVIYICISTTTGNAPPHTTYWTPVTVTHLRGYIKMESADLLAHHLNGVLVGMALGIPVYRDSTLAAGDYVYYDKAGNTLLTNVVD